ncbi:helix-turn-helix transcriptional regulator [Frankia sp. Mgl5]|uniref:winged helix-turn-helix transcriptional regulator n=1 Tax=Frankia sp. Mgl5 TaxID=2933793 RepID=UPI00200DA13A|nr:helix-turn-helix domain-containing protein [Frankia sp. Mgl5]MCK9929679.1 helix-turn-helix transcriptional regulator [Frankia sp. Mgl5]
MSPPAGTVTVDDRDECPALAVLRRVGDKWSVVVLALLVRRSHGFNELDRSIEGLSRRMLTRTLRSLERDGLIDRTVHGTKSPRVDYAITDLGRTLCSHVSALGSWAAAHKSDLDAAQASFDAKTAA